MNIPSGILYGNNHRGFYFSEEFCEKLTQRKGFLNIKKTKMYLLHKDAARTDKDVIQLFLEMGSEKSGSSGAEITFEEYHPDVLPFVIIKSYDSLEYPELDTMYCYREMVEEYMKSDREKDPILKKAYLELERIHKLSK